ncbi:hypothetical protein ACQP1V_42495 [Microtetraspora malaysiensis]|uniref:hypothetical protein n=1 Tax=Microtetraspora malaysiensis TaxID=161358 RepID=UPI003D8B489B
MTPRLLRVVFLIYLAVGVYVAWTHHYLTPGVLRQIAEAFLSVFLWVLVLLGVDLHLAR